MLPSDEEEETKERRISCDNLAFKSFPRTDIKE